jgi:hypothetical protein
MIMQANNTTGSSVSAVTAVMATLHLANYVQKEYTSIAIIWQQRTRGEIAGLRHQAAAVICLGARAASAPLH